MKFGFAKPLVACFLIVVPPVIMAEEGEAPVAPSAITPSALPTVALGDLLESVAKKSNMEFLIDSRVPTEVVIGQLDWHEVTFPVLHTVLRNNELAAVTVQGKVNIVPVGAIRQYALPVLYEDDETIADDAWVTRVVRPKNADAAMMVPTFRALLPQQGHLAAVPPSNTLTTVARYANVKRIAEMVEDMDAHTPEPADNLATESCDNGQ
jgi:general secretion pathway protein D